MDVTKVVSSDDWVFSDPMWWLSATAMSCAAEGGEFVRLPQGGDLAEHLRSGYGSAMSYLATANVAVEDAARCLFWAKALRKWRCSGLPGVDPTSRAHMAFAGYVDRNVEASTMPAPRYLDGMRRVLAKWLPDVGDSPSVYGRFGPGAVAERYPHPQRFCLQTEWLDAGMDPMRPSGYFPHDVAISQATCRLCAVPKDWDKDRLITVEPCYQSYVQQSVRRRLLESIHSGPLRGTAMDLGYTDGQEIQRRLALRASKSKVDATLDLKDASDRITWDAVQAVFPPWVVDLLWESRSSHFEFLGRQYPQFIFAGMGNATTFVVETLFFSAYVVSFQKAHGLRPWVSTFGDDVICSSATAEGLLDDDPSGCFVINRLKSYWGAMNVRESCGVFAYQGEDITVPKIAGYPATFAGRLGVAELQRACNQSRFIFLNRLSVSIAQTRLLPNWEWRVEGFPSFYEPAIAFDSAPTLRRNQDYQAVEALVEIEVPRTVSYPCEDSWFDDELSQELGPTEAEQDAAYKRGRLPPAKVWLDAVLAGQVSTTQNRINSALDNHRSRVVFPLNGSTCVKRVWRRACRAANP